jgi:hypothetical protein
MLADIGVESLSFADLTLILKPEALKNIVGIILKNISFKDD